MDREAVEKGEIPARLLMENAGRSAALLLRDLYPEAPVVVVAGSGNNGGDGLVLARTLGSWGVSARVLTVGRNALEAPLLHGWNIPVLPLPEDPAEADQALGGAAVVIDALLGTGISGPPRAPHARAIEAINRAPVPVVSLDLPSGVSADSGETPGASVRAEVTIAFGAPKLGSLRFPGRELSGRIIAVEIGFPPWDDAACGARVITPGWFSRVRPRRSLVTHKNAEGRLLLFAGREGMAGAAILAARAALEAGTGFVRVMSAAGNREVLQQAVPEATFVEARDLAGVREAVRNSDALAAGPGIGTDGRAAAALRELLEEGSELPVVLDADALTLLAAGELPDPSETRVPESVLLTPHPGEMARLIGRNVGANPIADARAEAERRGATVLLKGSPSIVAPSGGGPAWVSPTGSSALARAGMGDVLTGAAAAFLARGAGALEAAGLALHATGWAAHAAGRGEALLPSDVVAGLGSALLQSGDGATDLEFPFILLDLDPPG